MANNDCGYTGGYSYTTPAPGTTTTSGYAGQYATDRDQYTGTSGASYYPAYASASRTHASSLSSYGSGTPYPTTGYSRSLNYPGWSQAPQTSSATNGYTASPYYSQVTTGYDAPAYTAAVPVSVYTTGPQYQNQDFLSPHSAISSSARMDRDESQASTSASSDDQENSGSNSQGHRCHICNECGRAFRRKADLLRHSVCVHHKELAKIYYCNARVCDRNQQGAMGGFTRKDHLVEHLRNFHHRNIPKRVRGRGIENEPPLDSTSQVGGTSTNQQVYYGNGYANTCTNSYTEADSEPQGYEGYAEDDD